MKLVLPLLMFVTGCASYVPVSWDADFRGRDGSPLQISGKPFFSDLGETLLYLCPPAHTGDPTGDCLDIVASATLVTHLRQASAECIVVSGKFSAFGSERIGMGYYRSDLGYLDAVHAAPCHGR